MDMKPRSLPIRWYTRTSTRCYVTSSSIAKSAGFAGCCSILQTGHITLSSTPDQQLEKHSTKYHRQQPLYNTLELLMMGIVVPETCWASNKICNKTSVASSWHFISTRKRKYSLVLGQNSASPFSERQSASHSVALKIYIKASVN